MSTELLLGLASFAFASSITPGPNNLMLMASGTNFGFRPTLPHMMGVSIGFMTMTLLVGLGVAQLMETYPAVLSVLKAICLAFVLYLAYRIATSKSRINGENKSKPLSFVEAALFQWVNPKAWAMSLTAISLYSSGREFTSVLIVALVFGAINLPCILCWVMAGQKLKRFLSNETNLIRFNYTMAALLVLSMLAVL